jgi:hypothetical protein
MASSGMLCRVALVITDVSEELSASFIRVTRIGELGTTLAVTSNRRSMLVYAELPTVFRAAATDLSFNCWCLEILSDKCIRHVTRCAYNHA